MHTQDHSIEPAMAGSRRLQMLAASLAGLMLALSLAACSPRYDWREMHGESAPFVAQLPGKPASFTRTVDLDGIRTDMKMDAARVGELSFAIGSASLPDAALAHAALAAMKTAMVRNIHGTILKQGSVAAISTVSNAGPARAAATSTNSGVVQQFELEASGSGPDRQPFHLTARFAANGKNVYQAVVIGPEKNWPQEEVEWFLASFKPG